MDTGNRTGSTSPRFAAGADRATEASVFQAFLSDLERQGLVQSAPSQVRQGSRGSDSPGPASGPADVENAVRKLIAVLEESS